MHLGHARTFLLAQEQARSAGGRLVLRIEDIDRQRCREEFEEALMGDLRWAGLNWDEGPDCGGDCGPYRQSERWELYVCRWRELRNMGAIYPCFCSRRDVQLAAGAPHEEGGDLVYPGTCRDLGARFASEEEALSVNWRFRVKDGERVAFLDGGQGPQSFVAGEAFGDFLVWRKDGMPAYELAVVADDIAMEITEVVRGEDLLISTARQLLLYRALGKEPPSFFHGPLVRDREGRRLAKRSRSLALREMRRRGIAPQDLRRLSVDELEKAGG